MALPKIIVCLLASSLLVLCFVEADDQMVVGVAASSPTKTQNIDCGGACASRCKLSSRPNLCHRACGTCCARCSCVPPGTSGNYEACPCYATLTTHGGRRKCP
ncbi:gibberellin-regulated protein 11 [Cucumis sativus]|uniref:Uncharacterized protein n=1 Tax=Cucumis sativus TaxID=3659 RepID=A0A0A0LDK8_CUCSA|nr:gibberellin-regulated protein 11 [Cucumis sativus]KGN60035.1 hypothetical protein Csa_001480 [Cucumis sativus]